jgi:type IV pilus assembly protein PilB
VLAQRLLRRVCTECKTAADPDPALMIELGLPEKDARALKKIYKGTGCTHCRGTGYAGRVGLYELLQMTDPVKQVLLRTNEANEIRDVAQKDGMKSMRQYGLELVKSGMTTVDELVQATRED